MKIEDDVWAVAGDRHGCRGTILELSEHTAKVEWDGRKGGTSEVPLECLEPAVFLHLTCCDVGKLIGLFWIVEGMAVAYCTSRTGKGEADWALTEAPDLFDSRRAIRVSFCPGCGTETPFLARKAVSSYHVAGHDHGGTCNKCQIRYCSGTSPSRIFEIEKRARRDRRGVMPSRVSLRPGDTTILYWSPRENQPNFYFTDQGKWGVPVRETSEGILCVDVPDTKHPGHHLHRRTLYLA